MVLATGHEGKGGDHTLREKIKQWDVAFLTDVQISGMSSNTPLQIRSAGAAERPLTWRI